MAEACSYIRKYVYVFVGPTEAEIWRFREHLDTQDFDMGNLDPFSYNLKFEWYDRAVGPQTGVKKCAIFKATPIS